MLCVRRCAAFESRAPSRPMLVSVPSRTSALHSPSCCSTAQLRSPAQLAARSQTCPGAGQHHTRRASGRTTGLVPRRSMGGTVSSAGRVGVQGCKKAPATAPAGQEVATFAGGCFWGLDLAYSRVPGVTDHTTGYTQGSDPSPTYESVCSGRSGHTEAVQVYYNPKECSYEALLDCFFEHVDPTTKNRQGMDMGSQYRSGVYFHNEEQKAAAQKAFASVNDKLSQNVFRRVLGTKVVSELLPAGDYFIAEPYHQRYLERGGRFGSPQNASKGATEKIRCYG